MGLLGPAPTAPKALLSKHVFCEAAVHFKVVALPKLYLNEVPLYTKLHHIFINVTRPKLLEKRSIDCEYRRYHLRMYEVRRQRYIGVQKFRPNELAKVGPRPCEAFSSIPSLCANSYQMAESDSTDIISSLIQRSQKIFGFVTDCSYRCT